ncbi:unnamed protein product [Brassica rapa]|uniref:Uncharacterized protein n=1 Tax=Brassica campestris TaxID=3711 RepID=A0A3P6A3B1_BRACM|nr:unnamed protein product [Brassica rapa]VDC86577.1 unnamed protein product [Brassica rapa]
MDEDVLAPEILTSIVSRLTIQQRWTDPCSCQGQEKKPDMCVCQG